jgi:hypothetical protein
MALVGSGVTTGGQMLSRTPMSLILAGMSAAQPSTPKTGPRTAKVGSTYRGVRVQVTDGRSRFTLDQIKRAVETAVVKNANALAGRTKA